MDLHLNISGGLTGDMFIAAVLDAFPRFEQRVIAAIDTLDAPYPVVCSLVAHADRDMTGHRFKIEPFDKYFGHIPIAFPQERANVESVRERLLAAEVGADVRMHATQILALIAKGQSALQGSLPERMGFEAGAWETISQVVGAATLIDALDTAQWSASAFPSGEGVTLAGAAIVDYLCPPRLRGRPQPKGRSLVRSGTGFGSGPSQHNYLRLLCFGSGEGALLERHETPAPRRGARPGQQTRQ